MSSFQAQAVSTELAALGAAGDGAQVHSVFRTALNGVSGGQILTVLSSGRHLQPYSARIQEPVDFTALGLEPGTPIHFGTREGSDGEFCLNLAEAEAVELSITARRDLIPPTRLAEILTALADVISSRPEAEQGLAPVLSFLCPELVSHWLPQNHYSSFLMERIKRLGSLLPDGDSDSFREMGGALAGCGLGLTPSSDDFLCGVMAALYGGATAGLFDPDAISERCQALSAGAAPKTGDISAHFLRASGIGLFGEDMLALLDQVCAEQIRPAELRQAALEVASFGSTSGCDILSGFWFGLWSTMEV